MKILLAGDFSDAMSSQPQNVITDFIEAVDKLEVMTKPQILLLDTVVELSSLDDGEKLYAYLVSGTNYAIFSFTPKNELLILDYIHVTSRGFTSITFPEITDKH